ncbi:MULTISPECIES: PAAR-like domain-containing protein [unclassified Myxococcus]|uniref:PAAR-like domain-containing protein n=1 Tax=unclassified Myxococcus TaxID=2648731 RepID=UPI0011475A3D|nr:MULTISPECIES: PAAR-like domain-containing protein [unclassified Myxococcus]
MPKVSINAPKTPVTEGSSGIAAATLPNVCKMPGPPAPFVPTPLPNIGKSGQDPRKYTKSVTIAGKRVAIQGATFGSMGDIASKGTGGGIISANVEGPTSFVGPGAMDVKFDGKNVQLLGDPMLNNCGPSGSPANAATMLGVVQAAGAVVFVTGDDKCPLCKKSHGRQGSIKETKATKVNAERLAKKLAKKEYPNATMIGVVQCRCKAKHYAERSGETDNDFCASAEALGWHHAQVPKGEDQEENEGSDADGFSNRNGVLAFLKSRFKERTDAVEDIWVDADNEFQKFRRNQQLPAAYPPGRCAAPKALVLVMQDKAFPGGITEQWFHPEGKPTRGQIKFRDRVSGTVVAGPFEHGTTVPPCGTCCVLLPMMICPEVQEPRCHHTKK